VEDDPDAGRILELRAEILELGIVQAAMMPQPGS
jgi:hypothetical protein